MKKEICEFCGQKFNKEIWLKHVIKKAKESGLPSLAKLLKMCKKKEKLEK